MLTGVCTALISCQIPTVPEDLFFLGDGQLDAFEVNTVVSEHGLVSVGIQPEPREPQESRRQAAWRGPAGDKPE